MKKSIFVFLVLPIGAFLQGLAMSLFLFPHSIPSGGAAGLAILMNHLFQLPLGFSLWLANGVFLLFALKYFGYTWTIKTIISVAITSTTVTITTSQIHLPHTHLLLDMLVGSVLFGIGVGLLIRVGSSSGGMVIPTLMIASYKNWSPGKTMFGLNLFIFSLTAFIVNYKIVFYAIICQFLSTHIIDIIYELNIRKINLLSVNWRK